jgi:hypothetical protein
MIVLFEKCINFVINIVNDLPKWIQARERRYQLSKGKKIYGKRALKGHEIEKLIR